MRVAIGLGSNLGDREGHLGYALNALSSIGEVLGVSSIYRTAPVGDVAQDDFLNAVVLLETELSPAQILERCLDVEAARGRVRTVRWGPRTLDLDVLLYNSQNVAEPGLRVPHPELVNRRFVLEPLLEVWPDAKLPSGEPLAPFLDAVADQQLEPWTPAATTGRAMFNRFAFLVPMVALILIVWWLVGWLVNQVL